jgi:hypothetical protein
MKKPDWKNFCSSKISNKTPYFYINISFSSSFLEFKKFLAVLEIHKGKYKTEKIEM